MSKLRKRSFLLWFAGVAVLFVAILAIAGYFIARRFEPFIREQTAAYLRRRFDSELSWKGFHVRMPLPSPLHMLLQKGKGAMIHVEADGIILRHKGRTDIPPLVAIRKFNFEAELTSLLAPPAHIKVVRMEGLELNIPPRGERPKISQPVARGASDLPQDTDVLAAKKGGPRVIIDRILADGTRLMILPKDRRKPPLDFDIHRLRLDWAGPSNPMRYYATLQNALPPGLINSNGTFGPWVANDPGDTSLSGDYTFRDADLSVFEGMAGILSSTGKFRGQLDEIFVDGETITPDFRLQPGGSPMPLQTKFHAIVDGTNGNTLLEPVEATLNKTHFTARGGAVRNPGDPGRTISLDVILKEGRVEDFLRLAVKGVPVLKGGMDLQTKFLLPPGRGEVIDRLHLQGNFKLHAAQFTSSDIQEKIDSLSRRSQGQPKNREISRVPSDFVGKFRLQQGVISLQDLRFAVPGASILLDGSYMLGNETLDFRGQLRLQAKVSQTVTGWKRLVLKPVDPFFAKDGAGTLLRIKITGTRANPDFGRD